MRRFFTSLALLTLLTGSALAASAGDWQIGVKSADGPLTPYWVTLANGQVLGKSAGVPAAITPLVSGDLTPYLLSATAATTYEPIIGAGTLALSKLSTDPLARSNHTGTQAWSTITSTPTTLAGYGITDPVVLATDTGTVTNTMLAGSIANAKLANSSITINGSAVSLGGSTTISTGLTIGTTTITSGTSGRLLYNNGGFVGELALGTGVGTALGNALSSANGLAKYDASGFLAGPAAATFIIAPASGQNLALYPTAGGGVYVYSGMLFVTSGSFTLLPSNGYYAFGNSTSGGTADTFLYRDAAAVLALRNTTTAQTFRIYGTTTGGKYLSLAHDGTNAIVSASSGEVKVTTGGLTVGTSGSNITTIKRASVTLVAGTATVSDTATTANSVVLMARLTPGGTLGHLDYDLSAGSSYTINSSSATETSVINITVLHFP